MKIVITEDDFTSCSLLKVFHTKCGHDITTKVNRVRTMEARHDTDESA